MILLLLLALQQAPIQAISWYQPMLEELGAIADTAHVLPTPASADSLWRAMLACSGATVQPGGDLADVKWRADPERLRSHHARAEWVPPDTIILSPDATAWEIAHELLHHVKRGPPDNAFTMGAPNHPMNPFYFPCKVMPHQNGAP